MYNIADEYTIWHIILFVKWLFYKENQVRSGSSQSYLLPNPILFFSFYRNVNLRNCHIIIQNRFVMMFFRMLLFMGCFLSPNMNFRNRQTFAGNFKIVLFFLILLFFPKHRVLPRLLFLPKFSSGCYRKLIKNVIERVFKKSANRLPTSGISRYAFTEGSYFSHTTCIFAMAFGVAPIPNPHTPELITAAS